MEDLHTIIEDAITDVELPETPVEDSTPTPEAIAAPEAANEPTEPSQPEAPKPETPVDPADEFDKKFGLAQNAASGRENRIPYSRVKKISDKAAADAVAAKVKEYESSHIPVTKYQELETRVTRQDEQLKQIGQFEQVMANDPARFLTLLYERMPQQYAQYLAPLFQQAQEQQTQTQGGGQSETPDMPQPDQTLSDGSKVYSYEGLKALRAWDRAQTERALANQFDGKLKAIEDRYKPLEQDYQSYQRVQAVLPKVQEQISDARKWPLFNESEDEIVKSLKDNPTFSLERAYQTVVWPKMQSTRDKMRADILNEVKQAPRTTAAPSTSVKSAPVPTTGPRSLEDVINESIQSLKR